VKESAGTLYFPKGRAGPHTPRGLCFLEQLAAMSDPIAAEIAALEAIRGRGVQTVAVDGVQTTYFSPEQIDRRLRELRAHQNPRRRPRVSSLAGTLKNF